jgi:hypothetical protein
MQSESIPSGCDGQAAVKPLRQRPASAQLSQRLPQVREELRKLAAHPLLYRSRNSASLPANVRVALDAPPADELARRGSPLEGNDVGEV